MKNLLDSTIALIFIVAASLSTMAYAGVTTYSDRVSWQAVAGSSTNIDFSTLDDGSLITPQPGDQVFSELSLRGGWTRIDQTRAVEPLAHRQQVNVLGALRHDGRLIWATQQRPTRRADVIAFLIR